MPMMLMKNYGSKLMLITKHNWDRLSAEFYY